MKRCLITYKDLPTESAYEYDPNAGKALFGTWPPPIVNINLAELEAIAREQVNRHLSVTGAQKKLSASISKKNDIRTLLFSEGNSEFIFKVPIEEYPELPTLEALSMQLAGALSIKTAQSGLVRTDAGELCYLTRRFDRKPNGERLHVEDFAQILEVPSEDKYRGSHERIAKAILQHCSPLELSRYYQLMLFCFLTGNEDMHLKNFMLVTDDMNNITLSPAYDLVPSGLYLKHEELALTLNGKRNQIKRRDFLLFEDKFQLTGVLDRFLTFTGRRIDKLEALIRSSFVGSKLQKELLELFRERFARLQP
ncbi:MAG: HipA domain-containing protein [Bacteroidota bacterium]